MALFTMPRATRGMSKPGVERFERKFGPQTNERTVERNMRNAVPDYARYTPPGDEQQEISGAGRGRRNGGDGEPDLAWAYEESARRDEMERREREAAVAAAAEAEANAARRRRGRSRRDAAKRSRGQTLSIPADGVTLIVTGTGTEENVRNEIEGAGTSWECDAGLGLDVVDESAGIAALEAGPGECGSRAANGWRGAGVKAR